jgi:aryl-alcohol dehydrogenase-like predicted oxidoreductase
MPGWLMTRALWICDKHGLYRPEWVQNAYSLMERGDEQTILPLCADQQLGYTPFSPLAGGWLTGKYHSLDQFPEGSRMTLRPEPYFRYLNEATFDGLRKLKAEAERRGVSMSGLALAWLLNEPLVTAPIIGPRKPAHLDPVREALDVTLSADERNQLRNLFPNL